MTDEHIKEKGRILKERLEERFDENIELNYVTKKDYLERVEARQPQMVKAVEDRLRNLDKDDVIKIERQDGGQIPRDIQKEIVEQLEDKHSSKKIEAEPSENPNPKTHSEDGSLAFADLTEGEHQKAMEPVSIMPVSTSPQAREGLAIVSSAAKSLPSESDTLPMPGRGGPQKYFKSLERAKRVAEGYDDKVVTPVVPRNYAEEITGSIQAWTLTDEVS